MGAETRKKIAFARPLPWPARVVGVPSLPRRASSLRAPERPAAYQLSVGKPYSVECGDDYLARLLPTDPNTPQKYSGLGISALILSDADQLRLCGALVSTDSKPVDKPKPGKPES